MRVRRLFKRASLEAMILQALQERPIFMGPPEEPEALRAWDKRLDRRRARNRQARKSRKKNRP